MNRLHFSTRLIAIAIAGTLFLGTLGCEKELEPDPVKEKSILGLWVGTYEVDNMKEAGKQYYSLIIKPDGTVIIDTKGDSKQHLGVGNWIMKGDTLVCTTSIVYGLSSNMSVVQTHSAIFDKWAGKLMNGVWKDEPPLNLTGTFVVTKVE
jgi:hypothetical protein